MITLQVSPSDWETAKVYWSNIKRHCLTTALSNNEQIDFIDTTIFNHDVAEHKSQSVRVPSLRTINTLMDEIENETKQSKQENDLPVIIETHLSEKIEKFISRPVCPCTISHSTPK